MPNAPNWSHHRVAGLLKPSYSRYRYSIELTFRGSCRVLIDVLAFCICFINTWTWHVTFLTSSTRWENEFEEGPTPENDSAAYLWLSSNLTYVSSLLPILWESRNPWLGHFSDWFAKRFRGRWFWALPDEGTRSWSADKWQERAGGWGLQNARPQSPTETKATRA